MPNMPNKSSKLTQRVAEIQSQLNLTSGLPQPETCKQARARLLMDPADRSLSTAADLREIEEQMSVPEAETPASPSLYMGGMEMEPVMGGGSRFPATDSPGALTTTTTAGGSTHHKPPNAVHHTHNNNYKTYTIAVYTAKIEEADKAHWWFLPEDKEEWRDKYEKVKSSPFEQKYTDDSPEDHIQRKMFDMMDPLNRGIGGGHVRYDIAVGMAIKEYECTDPHPAGKVYVQVSTQAIPTTM